MEFDREFLTGRLNRATTFIKMRGFDQCIADCDDIESQIKALKREEFESDQEFYTKIMARALVKRAAAKVWVSRFEDAVKDFDEVLNNPEYCKVIGDRDIASLMKDKAAT